MVRPSNVDAGSRRWFGLAIIGLAACGATPTPHADYVEAPPEDGCTCERLTGPLVVPTAELPRWKRAKANNRMLVAKLVVLFSGAKCSTTLDDDVTRLLNEHEHVLRENRALKIASCDHFARWEDEVLDENDAADLTEQMVTLTRACALSNYASMAISELTIIRTCTTVSLR
jgi:hypothetical protein